MLFTIYKKIQIGFGKLLNQYKQKTDKIRNMKIFGKISGKLASLKLVAAIFLVFQNFYDQKVQLKFSLAKKVYLSITTVLVSSYILTSQPNSSKEYFIMYQVKKKEKKKEALLCLIGGRGRDLIESNALWGDYKCRDRQERSSQKNVNVTLWYKKYQADDLR